MIKMSKILIDVSALEKDSSKAVQGIKFFLSKNKNSSVVVIGDINNLLTIKNESNIELINVDTYDRELDDSTEFLKGKTQKIAFSLLRNPESKIDSYVTFTDKDEIASACKNCLKKSSDSQLYITLFANAYTSKKTVIGDLGFKMNPTIDDYLYYLNALKFYCSAVLKIEKPGFKYLIPSNITIDRKEKEIIERLKEEEGYLGLLETENFLQAKTDILLGNPVLFQTVIAGINQGITVFDSYIEKGVNTSFNYKIGNMFMKRLFQSFHASVDKKIISGGVVLLGFEKNVILVDKSTTSTGISYSLNLARQIEESSAAKKTLIS